ncbi:hypothetical protein MODO_3148 [Myroides odoratimimus]|uniref:hypothetical protein n=1 Tax=Myroides odoratimimus TaxID=76832 RepID=UPI000723F036|nr:hypothetical protein [Myroides odoratimimus]GAQ15452.1 hypothetical protein MODO_3148 [Myroides odoratimimus]STZ48151.1 Uncharacterised protein [Myroides odoratimimus]
MTEKDFRQLSKKDQDIFVKKIVNKILVLAPTDNHFAIGSLFEDFQAESEYLACLDETKQMLISLNFIEKHPIYNVRYRLTEKGLNAKKVGGLFEYEKSELKKEKELLKEKKRKKLLDYLGIGGGIIGIIGGIIGAIAGIIALLNNNSKEIEELNKKINSIENTIQLNNEHYIEQQKEYVKQIDSLYTEIKKLKQNK